MAVTTYSDLSSAVTTYIERELLKRGEYEFVFYQFAKKKTLPKFNSKTIQFNRFEPLSLPNTTLTEGTTPTSTSLSTTQVTATLDQWGMVVTLTDIAELTIHSDLFRDTLDNLKDALNRLVEREIIEVLRAGTNVQYAGGAASRSAIASTATITAADEIGKAVKTLKRNRARKINGAFVGICDPETSADIQASQDFREAHRFVNTKALFDGYIGRWKGVDWYESNFLTAFENIGAITTADSATAGSLTAGTTYDIVVTRKNTTDYIVDGISQLASHTVGTGASAIDVTIPSTSGYVYDVYVGTSGGTLYLYSSNNAAGSTVTVTSVPTSGDTVLPMPSAHTEAIHQTFIFGKDAYACVDLAGMDKKKASALKAYITAPTTDSGYASDSDPLKQRRKIGWKLMFKCVILNQNWIVRVEHTSNYS